MNVTASLKATLTTDEVIALGLSSSTVEGTDTAVISYANGISSVSSAIDQHWEKGGTTIVTLAASASVTYTLTSLTDSLSRSGTMAGGVRYLWIRVTSRTAGDYLTVGQAATNPWTSVFFGTTPGIKVYKFFMVAVDLTDKYVVAAGSNEQLKITNSGSNSITFQIALGGCSS